MTETSPTTDYVIGCADGSSFKPSSLDEFFSFPNIDTRPIHTIALNTPWGRKPFVRITVTTASRHGGTISYSVDGDEKDVFYVADKLEEWIKSVWQDYSWLAIESSTTSLITGVLGGAGLTILGIVVPLLFGTRYPRFVYGAGVVGLLFLSMGYILKRVRKWAFPVGIFAWGNGFHRLNKYRGRQQRLNLLALVSFLFVFVVGIASSMIANWISHSVAK
jgi:hypothetical protein